MYLILTHRITTSQEGGQNNPSRGLLSKATAHVRQIPEMNNSGYFNRIYD